MKAFKCDRCGKFDEGRPVAVVSRGLLNTEHNRSYELCLICSRYMGSVLDHCMNEHKRPVGLPSLENEQ